MRRFVCTGLGLLLLLFGCLLAHEQRILFTTRTHPSCPVLISAPSESKNFGFHAISLRNDSGKEIAALQLKVTISTGAAQDEVVDSRRVAIALAPGEVKRLEVDLASVQGSKQRARALRQEIASVLLFVESAEFSDGTQWNGDEPQLDLPVDR
jgi:hypothetical protein